MRLIERETEQAHLCIGLPALPYTTERRYVQSTIEAILSSGMSSRLFQEIREKRGLVYSVFGYFRPYADVGQGVLSAGTDLERVEETIEALVGELRKLRDERVPEEELRRTKELAQGTPADGFRGQPLGGRLDRLAGGDLRRDQDAGRGDGKDRGRHRRRRCRSWRRSSSGPIGSAWR